MGAEFERLHGIIQVLVLRYKDLEAKFEAKDKENHDLRQKISSFDETRARKERKNSESQSDQVHQADGQDEIRSIIIKFFFRLVL